MNLFKKMAKKPRVFLRITGLKISEFKDIKRRCNSHWKRQQSRKIVSGRPYGISNLENQILCLLMYYRTYTTQLFLGFWFNVDDATVCRTIKRLEPVLAKVVAIKKYRTMSEKDLQVLLTDATEQRIQRPKRNQKEFYSGKKKCHTIKTEITMTLNGQIVDLSKPMPGKMHDYALRKSRRPFPTESVVFADLGYIGLQKEHVKTILPYKKSKNHKLTKSDKTRNRAVSRIRIKVENKIRELKIFGILAQTYRNFRHGYGLKMNIIAGIVNMKAGF